MNSSMKPPLFQQLMFVIVCFIFPAAAGAAQVFTTNVVFRDTFEGAQVDTTRWQIDPRGFEGGAGIFQIVQASGKVTINATNQTPFWSGGSITSQTPVNIPPGG